jgi:hypothetical protein
MRRVSVVGERVHGQMGMGDEVGGEVGVPLGMVNWVVKDLHRHTVAVNTRTA